MTEMNSNEIKKRYLALQPFLPAHGWDTTWVDRLRTLKEFLKRGEDVALNLRKNQISAADYDCDFRDLCLVLHDLLMEAFPIKPQTRKNLMNGKMNSVMLNIGTAGLETTGTDIPAVFIEMKI